MKERTILINRARSFGWKFVRDVDHGRKFCGFYHGDPAAEVVYYKYLTDSVVQRAFEIAVTETRAKVEV